MATNFYYVYALKDPRTSPAMPFYVGKGTGSRAFDHLVKPDSTRKYVKIKEIQDTGATPIVGILADDLTEAQALKLEAELISAFGTIDTGGCLTNAVIPAGLGRRQRDSIVVPHGVIERAQLGLTLLKSAILEMARANSKGVSNSDVAGLLGLRSDYQGKQKDFLSYSILGLLLREGSLQRIEGSTRPRHVAK